ncbi:hypothetical protein Hanom_Chr15g01340651 [Helianthus anomalus]
MAEIVVFYDFVHFVGKMDFVAEPHPIYIYIYMLTSLYIDVDNIHFFIICLENYGVE